MRWMEDMERRTNPARLLRGAKSVIMVALAYPAAGGPAVPESGNPDSGAGAGGPAVPGSGSSGKVAAFARGRDYHAVIGERLRLLLADIVAAAGCRGKVCVDSSPLMEKAMAEQAGLGWIGRNSVLVSRIHGPWLLLGAVVLDAELEPDEPAVFGCGDCRRCMAACPTGALVADGVLDARRCLAHLTIEAKGPFPPGLEAFVGDRLFGCDDCLAACPFGPGEPSPAWEPREMPDAAGFLAIGEEEFAGRFGDTPLARAGRKGMERNAELVVRNPGTGGRKS
jgi:epoxyqueuosine reductase